MIEKCLIPFVAEVGEDDRFEELGILALQEKAEFVAGVFGIQLLFFSRFQFRPVEDEGEFVERWILSERAEEREDLSKVCRKFVLGGGGIPDDIGCILFQNGHLVLTGEMFVGIQSIAEREIAHGGAGVVEREIAQDGGIPVHREDAEKLTVAKVGTFDDDEPILIRLQIEQGRPGPGEEIHAANIRKHRRGCFFFRILHRQRLSGASGFGARSIGEFGEIFPEGGLLNGGVRIADGPGIQQQTGPRQEASWKYFCAASVQNIAVFLAERATGEVKRHQTGGVADEWLQRRLGAKGCEDIEIRQETTGEHMHPCVGPVVPNANGDVFRLSFHAKDLQAAVGGGFQRARFADEKISRELAIGHTHGHRPGRLTVLQIVVPGLQILQHQIPGLDRGGFV